MLTARDEDFDQILGLEMGADDYIAKPVQPRFCSPESRPCCAAPRPEPSASAGEAEKVFGHSASARRPGPQVSRPERST